MMRTAMTCLLVLSAGLAACDSDPAEPQQPNPTGAYQLATVNDAALPFLLSQSGSARTDVTAGTLTFTGDGTYTRVLTMRHTQGTTVTSETSSMNGAWSRSGNAVTLQAGALDSHAAMLLAGNAVSVSEGGGTYVYRR